MRASRLVAVATVHVGLLVFDIGCSDPAPLQRERPGSHTTSGGRRPADFPDWPGAGGDAAGTPSHDGGAAGDTDGAAAQSGAAGVGGAADAAAAGAAADAGAPMGGSAPDGGSAGASGASPEGGESNGGTGAGGEPSTPRVPVGLAAAVCPEGPFGTPLPSTRIATRIPAVPPPDEFNRAGAARHNIEGPLWWNGALYVSEFALVPVPESRILKITTEQEVSIQLPDAGSNGLALDRDGSVLRANHRDGTIDRIDLETGTSTVVAGTYDGARFNSPNDIAVRADGTIYFTDPSWQAPVAIPQAATRVYRVAPDGAVSVVDAARLQPNGITLSVDETTLYVAGLDGVRQHAVLPDGSVSEGAPLPNALNGIDGMGIDCAGNLYLTRGRAVLVLDPEGKLLGNITMADSIEALTNVAFGGVDRKKLYITGLGTNRGVFEIDLNVPGLPY